MRGTRRAIATGAAVLMALVAPRAEASSSSDELVRQARNHEAAHEEDLAARRYTEALVLDPASADAWLGLASVRLRLGETAEAERVYAAALERIPSLSVARARRARVRWALGRHAEAETDLEAYADERGDDAALRQLADWYGQDGRTPAQLAVWRRLLASATRAGDLQAAHEAERMVRALVVVVDSADPASSPAFADDTRRALARIAARGR